MNGSCHARDWRSQPRRRDDIQEMVIHRGDERAEAIERMNEFELRLLAQGMDSSHMLWPFVCRRAKTLGMVKVMCPLMKRAIEVEALAVRARQKMRVVMRRQLSHRAFKKH